MPFIGKENLAGQYALLDAITTNGSASYTMQREGVNFEPQTERNMIVSVNGVTQAPVTAYTISGSTITFSESLQLSDTIDYILILGDVFDIGVPSDDTVDTASIKNGAVTVAKMTIDGDLVPTANVTYDLGSSTMRWNDLYLSGNTIVLGDHSISANDTHVAIGDFTVSNTGAVAGDGSQITSLNASQLSSGTIPDARFPSALPAIDGSALTGIDSLPSSIYSDPGASANSLVIDSGSDITLSGSLTVTGNLQIDGTTTTINSTTLTVDDKNIVLSSGAGNAAAADGAGISVDGSGAALTYGSTSDNWNFNKNVRLESADLTVTGDGSSTYGRMYLVRKQIVSNGSGFGLIDFQAYSTGTAEATGARIQADTTSDWSASSTPANILFYTAPVGSTTLAQRMVIKDSGNVGIGTTNPEAELHINNSSGAAFTRISGTTAAVLDMYGGASNTKPIRFFGGSDTEAYAGIRALDNNSGLSFETGVGGSTAASERMRIDSSGRVFIGKTSDNDNTAGHTLHSSGLVVHTRDSSFAAIFNRTTDDGDIAQFKKDGAIVGSIKCRSSGGNLQIDTVQSGIDFAGDGWLPMRNGSIVDNDLDLGSSSFRFVDLYLSNNISLSNASTSAFLQVSTNILQFGTSSSDPVAFYSNNTERMRIDSSGNVGVGTASPDVKLHIQGSNGAVNPSTYSVIDLAIEDNSEAALGIIGSNYSSIYFGDAANVIEAGIVYDHTTNKLELRGSGNTADLTIDASGNVGVGTDNPTTIGGDGGRILNLYNTSHASLSVQAVDGTNDRNATIEILSSGNGGSVSKLIYGDTDTTPGTASPLAIIQRSAGTSTERMRINADGQVLINRTTSITSGTSSVLGITGNVDIDGNPGSTNVIRLHQSATEMGQLYAHTTGIRNYLFTGNVFSIKGQADATIRLEPGSGVYNSSLQWCGNAGNIATEGFEIWYDNDVGDVHLNTTYNHDNAAIRFHTKTAAGQSEINERFTIAGNGNIGINVPAPSCPLEISHTNLSAEPYSGIIVKNTSTSGTYYTGVTADAVGQAHFRFAINGALKWQWRVGNGNGTDRMDLYSWTAGQNVMQISTAGDVTITGTFTESSALRYKENVQDLEYNNIISQLKPKIYNKIGQEEQEVGLIAEDVEALDKTLVTYQEDGTIEGIKYTRLVPHLIAHIQKLEERLARIENGNT